MRHVFVLPALVAILSFGCSSSTPKPADDPSSSTDPASSGSDPAAANGSKPADEPKQEALSSGAKESGGAKRDDTIPDDYSLTPGDCDALGKHFAEVIKSDSEAGMNPKLTAKQKEQVEANIDKVTSKTAEQWISSCQSNLAGKIVDRRTLKCAMEARTANDFKACLGDDSKSADKPAGKPGKK